MLVEVNTSSYNLQFIPFAEDAVSSENEKAFEEIWAVCIRLWLDGLIAHRTRLGRR